MEVLALAALAAFGFAAIAAQNAFHRRDMMKMAELLAARDLREYREGEPSKRPSRPAERRPPSERRPIGGDVR